MFMDIDSIQKHVIAEREDVLLHALTDGGKVWHIALIDESGRVFVLEYNGYRGMPCLMKFANQKQYIKSLILSKTIVSPRDKWQIRQIDADFKEELESVAKEKKISLEFDYE